jgi:hypothetical protein
MKVKNYDTMQVLEKLRNEDKIIKMKFANIAYVSITSMTLMSSIKLIKEEYDKDMHIKIFVHVATEKKICDIKKHFEIMILEYNFTNESTTIVKMTISRINEMLNETSNKKIEMLNNQTSKKHEMLNDQASKEKEMKKTSQSITNNESISVSISHEKSDKKHIKKLNQSDEKQQKNFSLNNSHSSRQIDSENEDHFIKTSNTNDDRKEHFIKISNLKNDDLKKQAKSSDITHHKNPNRIAKA